MRRAVQPVRAGIEGHAKEPEEPFLAKDLEPDRPWVAERHRCVPDGFPKPQLDGDGEGGGVKPSQAEPAFLSPTEVKPDRVRNPSPEAVAERAAVYQAKERGLRETG